MNIKEQKELCDKASAGPWIADNCGMAVNAVYENDTAHVRMKIANIRGWGHLTGTLGLPKAEAIEVQKANAEFIATARTKYPEALALIEELKAGLRALHEDITTPLPKIGEFINTSLQSIAKFEGEE